MEPTTHVNFIWCKRGESRRDAKLAPTLWDDMADLTDFFRNLLRKNPEAFDCMAELEGFAPVRLSFRTLCPTVALVLFHPHTAKDNLPDVECLLVSGLEEPADIGVVKSRVTFPPAVWKTLDQSAKPVVVASTLASFVGHRTCWPLNVTLMPSGGMIVVTC